jgi:hypothetical protein
VLSAQRAREIMRRMSASVRLLWLDSGREVVDGDGVVRRESKRVGDRSLPEREASKGAESTFRRSAISPGMQFASGGEPVESDCSNAACVRYTYNAAGQQLTQSSDADCDGTPDRDCHIRTFNTAGNQLSYALDSNCDGTPDEGCWARDYDVAGNAVTGTSDADCDGTFDSCLSRVLDAAGNIISQSDDVA